jgi:hypothetical protein
MAIEWNPNPAGAIAAFEATLKAETFRRRVVDMDGFQTLTNALRASVDPGLWSADPYAGWAALEAAAADLRLFAMLPTHEFIGDASAIAILQNYKLMPPELRSPNPNPDWAGWYAAQGLDEFGDPL